MVWESWQPELQRGLWHQLLGLHLWLQHSCSLGSPRGLPWFPIRGCQAELKMGGTPDVGKSHLGCHLLTDRRCIAAKMGSSHSLKMKLKGLFWIFLFQKVDWQLVFLYGLSDGSCLLHQSISHELLILLFSVWRKDDATVGSTMSLVLGWVAHIFYDIN